jgi:RNAse (barnase) inhibitor barstar
MGRHVVAIDGRAIQDWDSFHDVFAAAFGFPDFYGRNLNAWIDCLTYVDDAEAGMVAVPIPAGEVLTLHLEHAADLASRCPEQYAAILEGAAFVNWRRVEQGEASVLALAFHRT